ncbi:MAG: D-glycerate dehydrogenase [Acidimicrobiia bacterium]|nr:D-glycerate dehydrogenase [Acidimicrobiia bacterium]
MSNDQIVVTRQPPGRAVQLLKEAAAIWVWPHDRPIDRSTLLREIATATGLYSMLTDGIDQALLDAAPHLKVISQMAVGVDNIDLEACRQRGIIVGHTPDVLTETTADLAFGLMIAAARRFGEGIHDVHTGKWGDWDPNYLVGHDVHGSTLGIIGFGRIGQAIARRATGFSMKVFYTQRHRNNELDSAGPSFVTLDQLLGESDHVIVATPLSDETSHLIGWNELRRMKSTATLINIGRGPLVDPDALDRALRTDEIFAAALDVTDPEPIPTTHPLASCPNCFITPHLGSATTRTRTAMAELAARNLVAGLRGDPMEAPVIA